MNTATSTGPSQAPAMSPRTRKLLQGAIVPTLVGMAWPNILVMSAQASTGLIETWWVSHLGTDALTGMALVFPGFMMMQMISGGAMGGGISSAIARALGAGRNHDANALVMHAIMINVALGLMFSILMLTFGRPLYVAMGGQGRSLDAAMLYSNVVFGGTVLVWLMNALASTIRGTGNMFIPAMAICIGVVVLIPLSPALIFGFGPIPAMGIQGGGLAVIITNVMTGLLLAWYILPGRSVVRIRRAALQWRMFSEILRVGAVGAVSTLQTSLTILLTTALVGAAAGPDGIAGYGTGGRLEYLLIPLVFGFGGPMVALVGTNIGAGQPERALRIALTGGALAFLLTETIGLAAATWPYAWLGLFGHDPRMLQIGAAYLRAAGPAYGFFGLGLSLYFASQGAGRLMWPLLAGLCRMLIAVGGGGLALHLTGSLHWLFGFLAAALIVYGVMLAIAVKSGVWFRAKPPAHQPEPADDGRCVRGEAIVRA
ncbi:MATE family efflux transporter [Acidisphaera sp. S103]|uniref:MATE family efflux transporter n=1 Tax=Acidisphaera sp. S103 TaxID=1747223 RepID=UPI001575F157|nr:MATE family efflux transporter [Acidisphaera sp. S103]